MGEYIVREALLKHKTLIPGFIGEYVHVDRIIEAPAVDVQEVRHGKWINHTLPEIIKDEGLTIYVCSRCKIMQVEKSNYCPNCGSKNLSKK